MISKNSSPNCATFCIRQEDHTVANSLRYVIMRK
jgi:DNA-directed RNA polymerase subunit L